MKILLQLALLLILIATTATAFADADADAIKKEVFDNISDEYVVCASYFSMIAKALTRSDKIQDAQKYERAFKNAIEYAQMTSREIRSPEMTEKVILSRFEMSMKIMLKEIDYDVSNMSILMNQYGFRCKEAMENPDALMKEWGDKVVNKRFKNK